MTKQDKELARRVAAKIRELRKAKFPGHGGQKKCAEALRTTPQVLAAYERGRRYPSEYRLRELADFFGVTVSYLRGEIDDANKTDKLIGEVVRLSRALEAARVLLLRHHVAASAEEWGTACPICASNPDACKEFEEAIDAIDASTD